MNTGDGAAEKGTVIDYSTRPDVVASTPSAGPAVVMMPAKHFLFGSAIGAAGLLVVGHFVALPTSLLAVEVFATIFGLFVFGSFKYQVHKNALTYGMLVIMVVTFTQLATSTWHAEIAERGWAAWTGHHLLTFKGLDELIQADTMLFILGLTLLVSVIAQTRLLEAVTFFTLRRNGGHLLPTVVSVTAVVAVASGILGGVSMIGLTIRTLVIIMMLAAAPVGAVRYAVMVCTAVTTICGIWLAYGEPPNLIMMANLYPHLDNAFFIRYGIPASLVSYLVIARHLGRRLRGQQIDLNNLDLLDANIADVRFLQASRHGEVMTPVELIEGHADALEGRAEQVIDRMRNGEPLGLALVHENISVGARRLLLGHYVSDELADGLDRHYLYDAAGRYEEALQAELAVEEVLASMAKVRHRAQWVGAAALLPFAALLIVHGINHNVPLFPASFAGFVVALFGIFGISKMRTLALREAAMEYAEYYFLFPLFIAITLLSSAGFFDALQGLIVSGIATLGQEHVAVAQFFGCTFLSAILDNNVVADFASHGLHGLDTKVVHFFAMAQIAGYALGGCWTHIGCAQSVVAFAFIQRDVDAHYTPLQWIKEMTPLILETLVLLTALIYVQGMFLDWLK